MFFYPAIELFIKLYIFVLFAKAMPMVASVMIFHQKWPQSLFAGKRTGCVYDVPVFYYTVVKFKTYIHAYFPVLIKDRPSVLMESMKSNVAPRVRFFLFLNVFCHKCPGLNNHYSLR